jgi:hypothetical protein
MGEVAGEEARGELRFGTFLWITRICVGAALAAGLLLALPPAGPLRRARYRVAFWVAVGALALRGEGRKLLPSANTGYLTVAPELGCVLLIEIGLACYIGGMVRRPVGLAFLCLALLVLAVFLPDCPGAPLCVALLSLGILVLARALGPHAP